MERGGWVYLMTNAHHTTLYTGVTSNLRVRIKQHKDKVYRNSFTYKYNIEKLVYFNFFPSIQEAISEEKRIKGGSRLKKLKLINDQNPEWIDLWTEIEKW
ncbi:excinuclease ABC subunit C [Pedobacter yonginense]|uniref:Excinuclease ABC subunit C n=1 Tax=Pedobacter yonginense TaxID=651869 RepID=A0A317ET92_9SPHI|nr:GIY-YIG nuclease family protein [Pedobacter yonginense]PWS29039.1 excinuclease ABC subunit C [Pedobacter yonginense]